MTLAKRWHPLLYARHLYEQATQSYSAMVCLSEGTWAYQGKNAPSCWTRRRTSINANATLDLPPADTRQHREQNCYQWNRLPTNASWYPATALLRLSSRLQRWLSFSWIPQRSNLIIVQTHWEELLHLIWHVNEYATQAADHEEGWSGSYRASVARYQLFFFSLHCRTSARHVRSTTGMSLWLRSNFPKKKKPKTNPTKTTKQATHTHKPRHEPGKSVREICKLSETKWNKRAPLSPSYVLVHRVVLLHVVQ